ncbi:unnamed protein product [Meloidogyne enterolobii]|uniref:Uncharacterized protein n=1 Tax=Meloidogyne enterolobii TaxID=390850 RepID=A0ACB0YE32_MELEN
MIFRKSVPVIVENSPRKKNQHKQPKNFNKNSVRRRVSSRNNF